MMKSHIMLLIVLLVFGLPLAELASILQNRG
nr:MAG TPA: Toxin Ibs, type I toxin-antitoxin system [Caudoviricetes sp.]